MDAELKAKWVEALRSGEYKQARKKLCDGDGYCCLGVLATIGGIEKSWLEANESCLLFSQDLDERLNLPIDTRNYLANKNDGGSTFAEIADYIEAHL